LCILFCLFLVFLTLVNRGRTDTLVVICTSFPQSKSTLEYLVDGYSGAGFIGPAWDKCCSFSTCYATLLLIHYLASQVPDPDFVAKSIASRCRRGVNTKCKRH
jgi:hypothetical protein